MEDIRLRLSPLPRVDKRGRYVSSDPDLPVGWRGAIFHLRRHASPPRLHCSHALASEFVCALSLRKANTMNSQESVGILLIVCPT